MEKCELIDLLSEKSISDVAEIKIIKALGRNDTLEKTTIESWLMINQPGILKFEKIVEEIRSLLSKNPNLEEEGDELIYKTIISTYNSIVSQIHNIDFDSPASNQMDSTTEFRRYQDFMRTYVVQNQHSKTISIDLLSTEALGYLALIQSRLNNDNGNSNKEIEDALENAKQLNKLKGAIDIGKSLLSIDIENTQNSVNEVSNYYGKESKSIKESNKNIIKNIKSFCNYYWLILALTFLLAILGIEFIILFKNIDVEFYSLLPIYSILTIFVLFFFKQYNRNIDLYNSYRFKAVSTEFMSGLLDLRKESPEDSKLIIEKTLDKILEDPSGKKSNDSVNLMTNNIKTPTGS